ncbi:hypothetical protein AtNW77_Chr5g0127521 [Arabidopsis thaliana]
MRYSYWEEEKPNKFPSPSRRTPITRTMVFDLGNVPVYSGLLNNSQNQK